MARSIWDVINEYSAGWIGGGTAGGMSPIGDRPSLQRNFKTFDRAGGWPYEDDAEEMNAREAEGQPGWVSGTPMRNAARGLPPGISAEEMIDDYEELGEAMGVPFNVSLSNRGGNYQGGDAPAKAGWAHAVSNFGNPDEENEPPEPPVVESLEEQIMNLWEEYEESNFGEEREEESADESGPEEPDTDIDANGFGGEEHEEPDGDEFGGESDEPGEEPDGDEPQAVGFEIELEPQMLDLDGGLNAASQMFGGEGMEDDGMGPPEQSGPMNPYPPEPEPIPNVRQEYLKDQTDDELEAKVGDPNATSDVSAGAAMGGKISNPLDLFAIPSAWDNVELTLRGSKHAPVQGPPLPAGQPVTESEDLSEWGKLSKWLAGAGAAASMMGAQPAMADEPIHIQPELHQVPADAGDLGQKPDAELPDFQLPGYRGRPSTPEEKAQFSKPSPKRVAQTGPAAPYKGLGGMKIRGT